MKIKNIFIFLLLLLYINTNCIFAKAKELQSEYLTCAKQDILILMLAYKDYINDVKIVNDNIYCIMSDGSQILYDDRKVKNFDEKISNSDLQDMLEIYYPLQSIDNIMDKDFNPGRFRCYEFLKCIYGHNKNEIEKNLKSLNFNPQYTFNKRNNANEQLNYALTELKSQNNPQINELIYELSGTFNYRTISGTNLLSPHSFGIAIDLKSNSYDYHKWTTRENGKKRIQQYPKELINIFEKHNFIWGGKWGYFDILHFEYRPEIILKSKYFSAKSNGVEWFNNIPLDEDGYASECIKIINNAFK